MSVAMPSFHHTPSSFQVGSCGHCWSCTTHGEGGTHPRGTCVNRRIDLAFRMPEVSNGSGLASECSQRRPSALPPMHPSGDVRVYGIP